MTEFSGGHPLHDVGDRLVLAAGLHFARHRAVYRLFERCSAPLRQSPNNVAFGNDAGDVPVGAEDHCSADPLLGEHMHRFGELGVGFDRHDLTALTSQDIADSHHRLPGLTNAAAEKGYASV
jgi:hypothetical protein